ncbi:MAG: ABC transporter ATP-binding protein [Acidimicrobiales bacterium]|jgi:oligopeptide/dipeptide ABC transporter ATP-binding protein
MAPVLSLSELRTEFHMRAGSVVAVDGVSFDVDQGECVGVVGESGCGKSTTGLSIMRLLPNNGHLTGGQVTLLGRDLADLDEKEMRKVRGDEVALIPQDPMTSLNPTMTIGRQIAEGVLLHRDVGRTEARARALEVLRQVEMPQPEERLDQYPHELSGGLRQRVMIAMALACEPKLLIADEPTTALDVTIQAQILDLIDELRQRLSMAVVLITHDMGVIAGRTDRVIVMYAGKVAEEAETGELFGRIRHPYSQALLASVPKIDQTRDERLLSIPGLPPDLSKTIVGCRFAPRCRFATEDCRAEEPALTTDTTTGGHPHRFACFHPVDPDAVPTGEVRTAAAAVAAPAAANTVLVENGPPDHILEVSQLVKEFPVMAGGVFRRQVGSVKAVSDVSFAIRRGETFGLVGESGCGKTTIGRLLVALDRANSGSIRFENVDISRMGNRSLQGRRRDLQLMFQDPYASLDPRMRVGTIIREPLKINKVGAGPEQAEKVRSLLDEVGLSRSSVDRYPHEFSGGQRQRIGLARALALDPKVIVADEPVSALDVSIQAQILNLMKDLQARHGLTYLMISHDLAVIRYMADTIGVMYLGKLVELGPARAVYERSAHHYTLGLLNAVPVANVDAARAMAAGRVRVRGELPSAMSPPSGCRFNTRCPAVQQVCREQEPPMQAFGTGHLAACHFPLQTPVALAATRGAAGAG